jgi:hypothetical protein
LPLPEVHEGGKSKGPALAEGKAAQGRLDRLAYPLSIDRDFQKIAPRIPFGERRRFQTLSRISLQCSEPQAA